MNTVDEWFDTHAHLHGDDFESDLPGVLQRAHDAGVRTILTVGTTLATSRRDVELAAAHRSLYAAVGIHPNDCGDAAPGDWNAIVQLTRQPRVVAVGETGLDRYWNRVPLDIQQDYFDRHLRLSAATGLPVVIHMRDCAADVVAMLQTAAARGPVRGVLHSFTADEETARSGLDLGLHLSFAGMVTYKKSDELRRIAQLVPLDRLLLETDSPYLSPHPHRGHRPNEPALLVHTAACLAEVRGLSLAELAVATTQNARRLFLREP